MAPLCSARENLWRAAAAASAPSEGFGFRAPPVADTARKASRCRPQVRERIAEARAENGEGAKLDCCIKDLSNKTEGEIQRGCCLHHGIDAHQVKKRSFAFTVSYIYCFRTHLVYLSFRHGVFILYTPCHLPPQREARALPRRAPNQCSCTALTQCFSPIAAFILPAKY